MYEFHVTGLIGPVVEAALPELTSQAAPKHSVLIGTADEPLDLQTLLGKLTDHGLVADHIVIATGTRWRDTSPPGTDPDEQVGYSAPRQS
jgi:hypothetical protein